MLKQFLFTLSAVLLSMAPSLGQDRQIQKIDGNYTSSQEIDKVVARLMDTADVTGLALTVFNNHNAVYQKAFGYSNAANKTPLSTSTIFYGASLSKAVFSVLVMQLVEEGVIQLDTPLQHYLKKPLPDYKFAKSWKGYSDLKGDKRYETITARMCLTHTTGFPNWRFLTSKGRDPEGKLYFQFDPGTRYSYSGEGLSLLQFVLEQITGKGLEGMAQERIFKPLGMRRTSYIYVWQPGMENQYAYGHNSQENPLPKDEADDAGAAGSMGTTPADYSKFLEAVLSQQLLRNDTYNEMFKQQVAIRSKQQFGPNALIDTDENADINLGYGLGWGVLDSPYGTGAFKEGHSEGYQHYSIIFPDSGIGVLILTNSDNGESIFKEFLEKTIGDIFTPWQWENYIPYDYQDRK
ncbi:serine hydrolase [uncultured Pontibacter sp.]|uniref:serine hydrolase domain-containing protein n=1 Tax=uncultured Pontibacter sp. TaxID=453356 RepID=UPI00260FD8BD|nr:serine hydrolase domain-containing protein [uncultured Pontibacter sp.]